MSDISEIVIEIVSKHADEAAESVNATATLDSLGITSLNVIEIIFDIEDHFDITIPDYGKAEDLDLSFRTIEDIIQAVSTLVESKS
jgi:acyl carrier protein